MREKGSVLLISLVLLLIMTTAGVTVINSSSLEEKITGNYRDQQVAFHIAEATLLEAENYIANTHFDAENYTELCSQGLCFSGVKADDIVGCMADGVSPWQDSLLWSDSSRVRKVDLKLDGVFYNGWYIIEFRCYVAKDHGGINADVAKVNDWSQIFRITVKANGGFKSTRVILQSLYKKNNQ